MLEPMDVLSALDSSCSPVCCAREMFSGERRISARLASEMAHLIVGAQKWTNAKRVVSNIRLTVLSKSRTSEGAGGVAQKLRQLGVASHDLGGEDLGLDAGNDTRQHDPTHKGRVRARKRGGPDEGAGHLGLLLSLRHDRSRNTRSRHDQF